MGLLPAPRRSEETFGEGVIGWLQADDVDPRGRQLAPQRRRGSLDGVPRRGENDQPCLSAGLRCGREARPRRQSGRSDVQETT